MLLAVLATGIGTAVDILLNGKPGAVFTSCYIVGCLLAVVLVQRKSVFGPMVQPPLVLAIVMPLVVLLTGHNASAGSSARLLSIAAPLITSFPAMASTTGVTVIIGVLRMHFQRKPDEELDPDDEATMRAPTPTPAAASARQAKGGAAQSSPAPSGRAAGRRQQPDAAGSGRARRSGAESRGSADRQGGRDQGGRAQGRAPGRERAGEGTPERGNRATPGRAGGGGGRQAPPGGQQRAAQRNQRRPPREDFWN